MKKIKILLIAALIFSCEKEVEVEVPVEVIKYVDKEVIVEKEVPVEVIKNVGFPPDAYSFTKNGVSTVSYGGQTTRLKQAEALGSALKSDSFTKAQLEEMFKDGEGFSDATLNGTGKNLRGKTAAYGAATVKAQIDALITEAAEVVAPAWNSDASAGVAGSYTDPAGSNRTVRINAKGVELNQAFLKSLMGALVADQIINGYLSKTKLDGGTNIEDNDNNVFAYKGTGATENNTTKMEHYWDEGFGYMFGREADASNPFNGSGVILNKYLKKVNASDEPGISKVIYDAFKLGRAAIVNSDYTVRDEQATIVKENISKVIGYKAAYYLRSGGDEITAGNWANAHHALSEGYGFILSLQFTQGSDGNPYMTNEEVNAMLDKLMAGNGFWDRTAEELEAMAKDVDAATGLN